MSYADWHAGMKVVCVETPQPLFRNKHWLKAVPCRPIKGRVYTIREIFPENDFSNSRGSLFLRLVEVRNPMLDTFKGPYEPAFGVSRFRPVQPRKTDISIFEAMLNDAPMQLELS